MVSPLRAPFAARLFATGLFALALMGASPGTPVAQDKELIAVLDLEAVGADEAASVALSDRLREVLLSTGRYKIVDRSQMKSVLDEQALQQTGCTSQECAVQVGRVLGVRKLIVGKIVQVAQDAWLVSAMMVDVETAETLRATSVRHRGDLFSLLEKPVAELGSKLAGAAPVNAAAGGQRPPAAAAAIQPVPTEKRKGMVAIAGGRFNMGERGGLFDSDASPPHEVTLNAFFMDETEVSQAEFERTMGSNPSQHKRDSYPVHDVTWDEAKAYCEKLGKRLPTEAEWEYAARAGTATDFFFGEDARALARYANFCGNNCQLGATVRVSDLDEDGFKELAPVKSLKPNEWGLYDVYGNIAEWVADWSGHYVATSEQNPKGPERGRTRVVRGGSWRSRSDETRSAIRESESPDTRSDTIGFRCAADGG